MVAAVKYPPLGGRGAVGGLPHLQYRSFPAAEANAALNAATMVIVQFESAQAVEKAEEIAGVEGVDMVLIGTNDLLADMGLDGQFEHAKVRDAYARTIAACRKHGKHVGVGGLARSRSSSPNSSRWARATSRPERTWDSCWRKPRNAPSRCATSLSDSNTNNVGGTRCLGGLSRSLQPRSAVAAQCAQPRSRKCGSQAVRPGLSVDDRHREPEARSRSTRRRPASAKSRRCGCSTRARRQIDALLAGQVDFIGPGVPTLATIWDRTPGRRRKCARSSPCSRCPTCW